MSTMRASYAIGAMFLISNSIVRCLNYPLWHHWVLGGVFPDFGCDESESEGTKRPDLAARRGTCRNPRSSQRYGLPVFLFGVDFEVQEDRKMNFREDTHLSKVVVLVGLCLLLAAVIAAIVAVSNHYSRDDEDGDGEGLENDQPSLPSGDNRYVTTKMLVCTFGHLGVLPAMVPPDGTCDIIFYEEVYYNQKKKSIQPTHSTRSFHVLQSLNVTYTMTSFGTSMATGPKENGGTIMQFPSKTAAEFHRMRPRLEDLKDVWLRPG
ncbi:hypothetical protein MRX96_018742 [Rhipicephalus microplus]